MNKDQYSQGVLLRCGNFIGSDVDENGVVDLRDFALVEGFCVEVISE
jgi:hypothetical protein